MLEEPQRGRRTAKPWILAAAGVVLVAGATVGLVSTVVFGSPAGTAAEWASGSASPDSSLVVPDIQITSASPTPPVVTTPPPAPAAAPTTKPPVKPKPSTAKPPAGGGGGGTSTAGSTEFEAQVLTLVNQERAKAGCAALTADSRLTTAARGHSADMAARGYFDHTTPDGVSFSTRITNAGYRWRAAAENIASGQKDPAAVMTAWMNSPGHKANILNCTYTNLGVGLAYNSKNTPYWTQDFGTPA